MSDKYDEMAERLLAADRWPSHPGVWPMVVAAALRGAAEERAQEVYEECAACMSRMAAESAEDFDAASESAFEEAASIIRARAKVKP